MTPPSTNPFRYCAMNAKHWRNPQEIKPGIWLVEECAGPKATTINVIVVKPDTNKQGWRYVATVNRPRYRVCTLAFTVWLRSWKITAPADEQGKLVAQMLELVKEHA